MKHQDDDVVIDVRGIHLRLSAEQLDVLKRVSLGQTYVQIGRALGVCRGTVYNRVLDVRNALGAEDRAEALMLLYDEGILR